MRRRSVLSLFLLATSIALFACSGSGNGGSGAGGSAGAGGDGGAAGGGMGGSTPASCKGLEPITEPAEQLFVAPDGDDSAAGTEQAPLASLAEASSRFPNGGTIIVRGGAYPEQRLDAHGTPDHPLFIRAAAGEVPVFDGSNILNTWSAVILFYSAENVVVEGLEIQNCTADGCSGIDAPPVNGLYVRNCHIHDMNSSGLRFTGKKIRLENNHVHDVALTNENNVNFPNGGWPTCMGTTPDRDKPDTPHADDVIIRGNKVENCWGEGIGVWFAKNAIVEGNEVQNPFNVGIYLDNSFNVTIARNFVHISRGKNGGEGSGILMGTEPYVSWGLVPAASHDISIENNVVVGGSGIGWWRSDDATDANGYHHLSIMHNTILATKRSVLGIDQVMSPAPTPIACTAQNNVFAEIDPSTLDDISAWTLSGNAWLGTSKPPIAGPSDITLDQSAPMVTLATDVAPLAKVVGTGDANSGIEIDYACKPRAANAPTRGAFEP